jgi:serine/threonine-protein kinase
MGVILYHLLTGRTPFSADTPLAVVVKHLTQPPKPPREIPGFERVHPGLEAVCLKAMQKEPGARFQSAREMRAAVRAALDGRAASAELATAPTAALPASGPSLPSSPSGPLPTPAPAGGVQTGPTDVASAPTIAGPAMASSKVTPLGTAAAAAPQPARGSGKVVAAVALVAALVGAGALAGARAMHVGPFAKHTAAPADAPSAVPVMPTDVNAAPSAAPSSPPPEDAPRETAQREPPAPPAPSAPRPNGPHATTPTGRPNDLPHAAPAASAAAAPSSPVAPAPPPPSPPPAAPSSPVTPAPAVTPPAPPPVAAFDGTKCQAQVGAVRNLSAGATVSKLRYAHAATLWSRCGARLASRPSAGFMVRVAFAESGGAPRKVSCAGCPPEAIACLKQMTEQGVSLIKTGEEAEFELGGAFTCP